MIAQGIEISKALDCAEKVFSFHLPGYTLGIGNTNSPFRNDSIPSFSVKWIKGKWRWKDWGTGQSGDVISFIQEMFGLDFTQSVQKIVNDYDVPSFAEGKDSHCKQISKGIKKQRKVEIDVKSRLTFLPKEEDWWRQFGIGLETLKKYNVKSCSHIFINKRVILCKELTFAYFEKKDKTSVKIYCPTSIPKWLTNSNYDVWQGWTQMDEKADILIITSSLKDVMSIRETTGYNSVALQAESILPKEKIINELKSRFSKIYVFYDNDFHKEKNNGRIMGKKLADKFNLIQIEIPAEYKSKDYSDLVKNIGKEKSIEIIKNLL